MFIFLTIDLVDRTKNGSISGLGYNLAKWAWDLFIRCLGFDNLDLDNINGLDLCFVIFRFCVLKYTRTIFVIFQTSRMISANLQKLIPRTFLDKSENMRD